MQTGNNEPHLCPPHPVPSASSQGSHLWSCLSCCPIRAPLAPLHSAQDQIFLGHPPICLWCFLMALGSRDPARPTLLAPHPILYPDLPHLHIPPGHRLTSVHTPAHTRIHMLPQIPCSALAQADHSPSPFREHHCTFLAFVSLPMLCPLPACPSCSSPSSLISRFQTLKRNNRLQMESLTLSSIKTTIKPT